MSSLSKRDSKKMEKSVRLTVFNKSNNNIINNDNITIIMIALRIVIIIKKYFILPSGLHQLYKLPIELTLLYSTGVE